MLLESIGRSHLFGRCNRAELCDPKRFFAEFFGFLFDNISACYLVFAFFFSTLLAFILLLIFDEYGLE